MITGKTSFVLQLFDSFAASYSLLLATSRLMYCQLPTEPMPNDLKKTEKNVNSYIRHSSVGFQMLGIIGVFTYAGYQIDQRRGPGQLVFSAVLGLAGVCIALYLVIRSLKNNDK